MARYSLLMRLLHPQLSTGFDHRFHGAPGIRDLCQARFQPADIAESIPHERSLASDSAKKHEMMKVTAGWYNS
jgi:hypothetical protein